MGENGGKRGEIGEREGKRGGGEENCPTLSNTDAGQQIKMANKKTTRVHCTTFTGHPSFTGPFINRAFLRFVVY